MPVICPIICGRALSPGEHIGIYRLRSTRSGTVIRHALGDTL
jgi:hypothetical protein